MSELENLSLEDILYAIELSGMHFSISLNVPPNIRETYIASKYPQFTKAERQAPYFCQIDFKGKSCAWAALDLKTGFLQIFEQRPDLCETIFKAVKND